MRVVIQQLRTRLFLADAGWTKDEAQARAFASTGQAILYCLEQELREVRVAMLFGDPTVDIYFAPFRETRARTERLRSQNKALRAKQEGLSRQVCDAMASLAQQAQDLPMKRKKKRATPPEEEASL